MMNDHCERSSFSLCDVMAHGKMGSRENHRRRSTFLHRLRACNLNSGPEQKASEEAVQRTVF